MSYDIQVFSIYTKEKQQQSNDENFFDDPEQLVPFTPDQMQFLQQQLITLNYVLQQDHTENLSFIHADEDIHALLTPHGLYFSAGFNTESIFEAGMTASELTDSGEFAKYDPQNNGWEAF